MHTILPKENFAIRSSLFIVFLSHAACGGFAQKRQAFQPRCVYSTTRNHLLPQDHFQFQQSVKPYIAQSLLFLNIWI
jgi:hypothetical protein